MRQILACVLVAMAARGARADACKPAETVAVVLSPANTALDPDEGIVVGLAARTSPSQIASTDLTELKWHFRGESPANVVELAPGLVQLRPLTRTAAPVLEDDHGKRLIAFTTRPPLPLQHHKGPAIKASAIVRGSDGVVRIVLDEAPPADVVAVMVFSGTTMDDPIATPTGWARVTDHAAKSIALDPSGNCTWSLPPIGHKLALQYVNSTADFATPSAAIAITQ